MLCNKQSEWSVFREYSNLFEIYSSEEIISHLFVWKNMICKQKSCHIQLWYSPDCTVYQCYLKFIVLLAICDDFYYDVTVFVGFL